MNNPIIDKTLSFAVRVVNLYKALCNDRHEYVMSKQLLRSGTSVGANANEAMSAESPQDFIHKLQISQKEINETLYWIELLYRTEYINNEIYNTMRNDAEEVKKILSSIVVTTKKRQGII